MTDPFRAKAPIYMRRLMQDFGMDAPTAAAVMGNAGHESGGLVKLQEIRPTVEGSRGGYGWFQWTGPRRRAFEAYCERNGYALSSDEANYAWLFCELNGSEKAAVPVVKAPGSLKEKVMAFEQAFERAGVKHYDSRLRWAEIALQAYQGKTPAPMPAPAPTRPPAPAKPASGLLGLLLAIVKAIAGLFLKGRK